MADEFDPVKYAAFKKNLERKGLRSGSAFEKIGQAAANIAGMAIPGMQYLPQALPLIDKGLQKGFESVKTIRKGEFPTPQIPFTKYVPTPFTGMKPLARLGAEMIPSSKLEAATQIMAGPILKGAGRMATKFGGTLVEDIIPSIISTTTRIPRELIKIRFSGPVDKFTKSLLV